MYFLNALQLLIHLILTTILSLLHYKVLVFFHFIEKGVTQRLINLYQATDLIRTGMKFADILYQMP